LVKDNKMLLALISIWVGTLFIVYYYATSSAYRHCDKRGREIFKRVQQWESWRNLSDDDALKKRIFMYLLQPCGYRYSGTNELSIFLAAGALFLLAGPFGIYKYKRSNNKKKPKPDES